MYEDIHKALVIVMLAMILWDLQAMRNYLEEQYDLGSADLTWQDATIEPSPRNKSWYQDCTACNEAGRCYYFPGMEWVPCYENENP